MKKIILVTGLVIFAGIKTSFSVVFEEGIGGFTPPVARSVEVAVSTESAIPITTGVSSSTDFSALTSFADAINDAMKTDEWGSVFDDDVVTNVWNSLKDITLGTEILQNEKSAIESIAKNADLLQEKVSSENRNVSSTINDIIDRAQKLQQQFSHQTNLDTLVSQLERAHNVGEISNILQSIRKEVESTQGNETKALQALVGEFSRIREKNPYIAAVLPLETINGLMDASISPKTFLSCLSEVIKVLETGQNTPETTTVEDGDSTVKSSVTVMQGVIHHREEIPQNNSVVEEISKVLNEIWDQSPAALEGKKLVLEAVTLIDSLDPGKTEVIFNRLIEALNGNPAKIVAAISVIEQTLAGLRQDVQYSGVAQGLYAQISGLRKLYSEKAISPDKPLEENQSTALLITTTAGISSKRMPLAVVVGEMRYLSGGVDEGAGSTVLPEKIAEDLGRLSPEEADKAGAILAQQGKEHRQNLVGTIASGIVELAGNHPDLAREAAGNLGQMSHYIKDPLERKIFIQNFIRTMAVIGTDNASMLTGSFIARLGPVGRGILTGIAVEDPLIGGMLKNAGVPTIEIQNHGNSNHQPSTPPSRPMGTLDISTEGIQSSAPSSYAHNNTTDGQQEEGYSYGSTTAGTVAATSSQNPSSYSSSTGVGTVPVVTTLALNGATTVSEAGLYAAIASLNNGEGVTPQDLIQAIITQAEREGVGFDKGTLVYALESLEARSIGDISLAGLNLSDYAATLMFENSIANFIHLLYGNLKDAGSLKNVDVNEQDYIDFASPQAIIKEILKRLKPDKKTEQRAKLKLVFPDRIPFKAFMIIFLSMVIFAIVLGRSVAKYYLDIAAEKETGYF